jgi:hypothetical protein
MTFNPKPKAIFLLANASSVTLEMMVWFRVQRFLGYLKPKVMKCDGCEPSLGFTGL